MKTNNKILFSLLTAVFLLVIVPANAQAPVYQAPISTPADLDVGTISSTATTVTTIDEAVLFYNPATNGPSITLNASVDDGAGATFDSYQWNTVSADGTETLITGETTVALTATALVPGYHKYRVYGVVDNGDGTVTCQSDEYEDIILFVLPELSVNTLANLNGNLPGYCMEDIPATPINLSIDEITADYSANANGYANPAGGDFTVNYTWFANLEGGAANPIDLGNTTPSYDVTIEEEGTYTFFVEVTYAVKTDDGTREYVVFTDEVQDGAGNPFEIEVTPIPGAPTISIGAVTE